MHVALKLGLTRLSCIYNVPVVNNLQRHLTMNGYSKKASLDKLDRKLEEFKSKKDKHSPKRVKVQNDGWRMVIELVTGMFLGVSIGLALDYIIGIEPLFLIIFSLLGFMAGVKTMMTTAKKMNETNNL